MSLPGFLRAGAEGATLAVKVVPRAPRDEIGEAAGDELRVRVAAPPVDAAANEALLRLLARALGCARGEVAIVRGRTSRHKVVRVGGLDAATVLARLTRRV